MKLSVVIPVMNQIDMASSVYSKLREVTNTVEQDVEFIIIDNGSSPKIDEMDFPGAKIDRHEKSIGVYPTFKRGFEISTGDVVAFFHSDLVIWEKGWNDRVMYAFEKNKRLGMVGFIGSNEIDSSGGRGLGTTSNFAGFSLISSKKSLVGTKDEYQMWAGSFAGVHGKVSGGITNAAVVDGCAMIIRREAWNVIGFRESFPLHHFYDRLISTQLLEKEWYIYVIGIQCDHFSGQTVNKEPAYHDMAEKWCRANVDTRFWCFDVRSGTYNWDATIYQEAERQWMNEYRPKGFIPKKIYG